MRTHFYLPIRNILLITILISSFCPSFAQLTGIKSIPGDYSTLSAAITDLNSQGVGAGGVTFNIAAGFTETLPSLTAGLITASGSGGKPIIFQKSGEGANPIITAYSPGSSTTVDGIITIAGGDSITFDGIDLAENSLNTTSTMQMEWGYGLVKKSSTAPFDGCRYVVIENCTVTLNHNNINSVGIYTANHTSLNNTLLTITALTDAMSNCTFSGNTVQNAYAGIKITGYADPISPYNLYDQNLQVNSNTVQNYGLASSAGSTYGIYCTNVNNVVVNGNIVNNAAGGGSAHGGYLYGIYFVSNSYGYGIFRLNNVTLSKGINIYTGYGFSAAVAVILPSAVIQCKTGLPAVQEL